MNADKPTERKTDALAELAEELAKDAKIIFGSGGGGPLSSAMSARQEKASRIIAGLAKVKFFAGFASLSGSADALEESRAIAEEGAKI